MKFTNLAVRCLSLSRINILGAFLCGLLYSHGQTSAIAQVPGLSLKSNARGPEVIAQLGDKLPEVAAINGKSADELRAILKRDSSLWSDREGQLHYVCETAPPEGIVAASIAGGAAGLVPNEQTFLLHSRPLSSKKLYLDFNGHVTSGTSWNNSYEDGRDITTPPFDLDGSSSTFNAAELERIQYIWQRVAEDFSPFDLDVTTEDPGVEALRRSSSSDLSFGQRVCIGGSSYDWFGSNLGGIAYIGSFGSGAEKPCFVFSVQMSGGHEKYTADAISHEAGHTLGLHHDGDSTTTYYTGHNNWAPVMGVGYYVEMVQWSKGEYANANNQEDDLAIIAGVLGYRADQHGDLMASAVPLSGTSVLIDGIIERTSDLDLFSFNAASGPVSFAVAASDRGPNLDVLLSLYDGSGGIITSANGAGPNAALSASVAAGTYYVSVNGTGTGDPRTGYSDYGSLGQYRLTGTFNGSGAVPPVAAATASATSGLSPFSVQFSSAGSFDPDGVITAYDWNFGDGTSSTLPNPSHTFNTIGTFAVTLVVRDASGLSSPVASIVINSLAPLNQLPVAVASVSSASGMAPLTVTFSSAGSYDPDGSLTSYAWNFGNGATSSSANPSYTFSTPGNYSVTLTVTDNRGGQSSRFLSISVAADPSTVIYVGGLTMSLVTSSPGTSGNATLRVIDANGSPRPGTTVSGAWSGLVTGSVTGTTDGNGYVTFTSKRTRKRGTFTFAVRSLSLGGYSYDATRNLVSSGSVTTP